MNYVQEWEALFDNLKRNMLKPEFLESSSLHGIKLQAKTAECMILSSMSQFLESQTEILKLGAFINESSALMAKASHSKQPHCHHRITHARGYCNSGSQDSSSAGYNSDNNIGNNQEKKGSDSGSGPSAESQQIAKKRKRNKFPKYATNVLKNWLETNIEHPYPSKDEKLNLASKTKLSLKQVQLLEFNI